jgi:hypothetical protein
MSARLNFSTNNGAIVVNTYDNHPVAFNAFPDLQTTSIDWYYSALVADIIITQISNRNYSFCAGHPRPRRGLLHSLSFTGRHIHVRRHRCGIYAAYERQVSLYEHAPGP